MNDDNPLANLKLTSLSSLEAARLEQQLYRDITQWHSEPAYRPILGFLYKRWDEWSQLYFDGKLSLAHLRLGTISPNSFLIECRKTSGHGAPFEVTFNASIAFGPSPLCDQLIPCPGSPKISGRWTSSSHGSPMALGGQGNRFRRIPKRARRESQSHWYS